MTTYTNILKATRLRNTDVSDRTIVAESESDRGRVLYCAAFRRLQQKAQVFSMEPNAAVRSRLTHSLEVSQIGRYIADQISAVLLREGAMSVEEQSAFVNFVETSCLMHDIGNPPFGHFGEAAIKKWFSDHGVSCVQGAIESERGQIGSNDPRLIDALVDFREFDGNPQGLRIVARLQWNTDQFGLNLTTTTIASFLKYIRLAGAKPDGKFQKKAGYFTSEKKIIDRVWRDFGYKKPQRFPLAYVMEAADDIAYCVSDLEDSVEKGIVDEKSAIKEICASFANKNFLSTDPNVIGINEALANAMRGSREDGKEFTYVDFRTSLNRIIVGFVSKQYLDQHEKILAGEVEELLSVNSPCGAILKALKDYCKKNVYTHESIQRIEYAGYTAIKGLLDHFQPLLGCSSSRFLCALNGDDKDAENVPILIESKLLSLFPERYKKVYKECIKDIPDDGFKNFFEWNARAHLIVDYVSGMTDDFAMTTYRTLSGMKL